MNIQKLLYFVRLAEKEHMTNTAKELNISQPSLSYSISELEDELGVPLFKRAGRNIYLTQYGKVYYEYAKQALEQLEAGAKRIHDLVHPGHGRLNFGFIYTMGSQVAPRLVQSFLQSNENENIEFNFSQGNSNQMIDQLLNEQLDIVLTSKIDTVKGVHYEPFVKEGLKIVVPNNHPLASKNAVKISDTKDYPYVYYSQASGLRPLLDRLFTDYSIVPQIKVELIEDHTILGFVSQNFGIAIVPDTVPTLGYPVKQLDLLDQTETRWIYLAKRESDYESPALKRFYQFCLDNKKDLNL